MGSNGGEARSKVSLCLLSRERIRAGRLLRNGHKVCSLPAGCKEPEREREREGAGGGEPDSEVRKQRHKEEKSSEVSMTFDDEQITRINVSRGRFCKAGDALNLDVSLCCSAAFVQVQMSRFLSSQCVI